MEPTSQESSIRRLLDVGRELTRELDQGVLLDRILETAREITGARYAALGILNERHDGLERFLVTGVDEATRGAIGELPRGRGVLGVLIENPTPLRLTDVGRHPRSYGFPVGHPQMRGFLGVPIMIRGQAWGNLYLTEKADGEFTHADEEAAVILADWAAIAVENARLYETSERRRQEVEKALRGLEATRDVALAIGGNVELEHVLELIVKRGRALVNARSLVIMLRDGEDLVVETSAGHVEGVRGVRLPIASSTSGQVLQRGRPERIADVTSRLRIVPGSFGVIDPKTALLVPMSYRGDAMGVLAAFDRGQNGGMFTEEDEQTLRTFAASAATAVALAQSVQAERLRSSLAAAEAERSRWARDLHDETLQGLGGLRVLLSSALRRGDHERARQAMREAIEHIENEIENLRAIITELRPAALDELGLRTAIEALLDRHREQDGIQVEAELALPDPMAGDARLDGEIESTTYRLVQEALTNVAKHAHAGTVRVALAVSGGHLRLEVQDNGAGFDADAASKGFGLAGMRERASLVGGTLTISSDEHGTLVKACLPTRARRSGAPPRTSSGQVAS
ncbi:MAG: GAF domain-containing protein [Solirubrobacteraceae bacterium]